MYQINNFTDNDDIRILDKKGPFTVIEGRTRESLLSLGYVAL